MTRSVSVRVGFPPPTGPGIRGAVGYTAWSGYTGSLTTFSGDSFTSNTTYQGYYFPEGAFVGSADSNVSNVTFRGCRFQSAGDDAVAVALFGDNLVFDYCSVEPNTSAPPVSHAQGHQIAVEGEGAFNTSIAQLTMTHCDLWGSAQGINVMGATQTKPQVFTDCWIHDARADGGVDHTDGIGCEHSPGAGAYMTIDHCTIESLGNTNGIAFQGGTWDHLTITNNVIGGWGYGVHIGDTVSNIIFTDNVFSTRLQAVFGPLYDGAFATSSGSSWRRNKWSVPAGAAWGNPTHDGYFWIPDASDSPTDDTPFVSLTDFTG